MTKEFKVGDRVTNEKFGAGTVREVTRDKSTPILVEFDKEDPRGLLHGGGVRGVKLTSQRWQYCNAHELKSAINYKAGDRIQPTEASKAEVLQHWAKYWERRQGSAEVFYAVSLGGDSVQISKMPKGHGPSWSADRFELAPPESKFKVGDRVVNPKVREAGVGIVTRVYGGGSYQVNYKDTWYGFCGDNEASMEFAPTEAPRYPYDLKAGDKLLCVASPSDCASTEGQFSSGKSYTVRNDCTVRDGGYYISVASDNKGNKNAWCARFFEPITEGRTVRQAIVARVVNGTPRPSPTPFVHANSVLAATEARRLAEANPGNVFEVYERVSTSSAPVPPKAVAVTEAA